MCPYYFSVAGENYTTTCKRACEARRIRPVLIARIHRKLRMSESISLGNSPVDLRTPPLKNSESDWGKALRFRFLSLWIGHKQTKREAHQGSACEKHKQTTTKELQRVMNAIRATNNILLQEGVRGTSDWQAWSKPHVLRPRDNIGKQHVMLLSTA